MPAPRPTPSEAAAFVDTADRMGSTVRGAASWRHVAWLTGMAVATVMYLVGLGLVDSDTDVLLLSLPFVASVAVLSVALLPGARVSPVGFGRRWAAAVVGWGLLFAASMTVGLLVFRGEVAFWLPAGFLTALPLVLGARAEAPA